MAADYCQFGSAQECPATSNDPDATAAVLTVNIAAPAAGALSINSHFQAVDDHVKFLTVDNTCGPFSSGGTLIPNGIPGTFSGSIFGGDAGGVSAAVQVGPGNHTVRLCAASADDLLVAATLSISWVQSTGSVPTASTPPAGGAIDQRILDAIEEAFGG